MNAIAKAFVALGAIATSAVIGSEIVKAFSTKKKVIRVAERRRIECDVTGLSSAVDQEYVDREIAALEKKLNSSLDGVGVFTYNYYLRSKIEDLNHVRVTITVNSEECDKVMKIFGEFREAINKLNSDLKK